MSTTAAGSGSFVRRLIDVQFQLGTGTFGLSGFDSTTLSGLRVSAEITITGRTSTTAQVRIYGMTFSMMNQLSTLGTQPQTGTARRNLMTLMAGDAVNGMAKVFSGIILNAFFDGSQAPETAFNVLANGTYLAQLAPIAPSSYRGSASVATIMQNAAASAGWNFENNGVTTVLSNPYLPGTAWQQIARCAYAARCNYALDPASNTLAIWPAGGQRGGLIPLISPDSGLIGYPTLQPSGLIFRTLYNPSVKIGGQVQVQSSLPRANAVWQVTYMTHDLESMQPGGRWESTVTALIPGKVAPSQQ